MNKMKHIHKLKGLPMWERDLLVSFVDIIKLLDSKTEINKKIHVFLVV